MPRPAGYSRSWRNKGDGRCLRLLDQIAKTHLLVLDDWGLDNPTQEQQRILLELLDDRYERSSTLIASQFPTDLWYENLADPTLADAILDRVLHNAYRIELKGESWRKTKKNLPPFMKRLKSQVFLAWDLRHLL